MRHRKHGTKLNRTTEHRKALMRNLSIALIQNERIQTTQVKAKQLRGFIEPLITMAVDGSLHKRRLAFAKLQNKYAVHKLFEEIGPRFSERPGGYTRVVKGHVRPGDGAPMAWIELVDTVIVPKEKKEPSRLEQARKLAKQNA